MRDLKFRQLVKGSDNRTFWHYWGVLGEGRFVGPVDTGKDSQQYTGYNDKDGREIYDDVSIQRIWAMPNKWTFTIKPIRELLEKEVGTPLLMNGLWCDPFAGENSPAQVTNDLNPERPTTHHMDAIDFLKLQESEKYDGVLFDPPYSPRQVMECYNGYGRKVTQQDTQQTFWSKCKDEISRITKKNGKVICFGWNSQGIGKSRGFEMKHILLVPHGGNKNDTIVTVETKL